MRTNFKVSFYLRSNYENKEGKSPVMLRVLLNGEMANFSLMIILKCKNNMLSLCPRSDKSNRGYFL